MVRSGARVLCVANSRHVSQTSLWPCLTSTLGECCRDRDRALAVFVIAGRTKPTRVRQGHPVDSTRLNRPGATVVLRVPTINSNGVEPRMHYEDTYRYSMFRTDYHKVRLQTGVGDRPAADHITGALPDFAAPCTFSDPFENGPGSCQLGTWSRASRLPHGECVVDAKHDKMITTYHASHT